MTILRHYNITLVMTTCNVYYGCFSDDIKTLVQSQLFVSNFTTESPWHPRLVYITFTSPRTEGVTVHLKLS